MPPDKKPPALPETLAEGFATGEMWYRRGPLHVWTDGWFLLADTDVDIGFTIKLPKAPRSNVVGVRAFDKIELIKASSSWVPRTDTQLPAEWRGRGSQWIAYDDSFATIIHDVSEVHRALADDFKIKFVDQFSAEILEHVLVDLDMWMEEHPANENEDLASTIRVANYMLKHLSKQTKENPSWVRDEKIWARAKRTVLAGKKKYDEPYAVITTVYKKMGGRIKK